MKSYNCKKCDWEGMFPKVQWIKKRTGKFVEEKAIMLCPDCNNEIKN